MKRGLDWYQREQRSVLEAIRAAGMTDRQAAIYNIVLDLIYDGGGETPDDPKHIASYLSNVGAAAARTTVQQLVDMGKLFRVGGFLHQKRAENQAKTRRNLSETRAEIGRKGGISSGFSRRESSKNSNLTEANASSNREAGKEKEKEKKEEEYARESDARFDRVLVAVGLNPKAILPAYWLPPAAQIHVDQWASDLGLTTSEIEAVARGTRNGRAPPNGPKALDREMARYAAAKAAPPLTPTLPSPAGEFANARRASPTRAEQRSIESTNNHLAGASRLPVRSG